jgi:hypothetical protein
LPSDLITIFMCSLLGLMAHGARKHKWMEWVLRIFIGTFFIVSGLGTIGASVMGSSSWTYQVNAAMGLACLLLLFKPARAVLSRLLTVLDGIVSLRVITGPLRHKMSVFASMVSIQIFQPASIPHMVGLFCYIATFGMYLANTNLQGFDFPQIPMPMLPLPMDQLFTYNFLGLVIVSLAGIGILVTRKWREALTRLGLVKPTAIQVGIGLGLVVFSFLYDLVWALYTHSGGDMASKISGYNSGTFASASGFGGAVFLALATAICAGIGEETLIRGALQPVFGILPAAFLHGILHAQFANSPVLILQIAIWSCVMGLVRRFTNTTTTIIGHAGFNFVTTFLFAFNP